MATRACIPRVGMKAFPSSSASASASSSVEVVTMEYELRIRRKYFWVERAGEGRQRVVAVTAGDPSEVDVRTFRPSCPGVFNHLMPLYPFNLLASFGIAEDDISMSEEVREEMFCFVCNAAHEAKLAGNDRLKIVFSMNFCYVSTLASSPPEDNDPDLDRAVRESWALEQEERNTRRRRRRQLSDEEDEDEEESIMKKLKKVKYGSSSSSSSSSSSAEEEVDSRYCFSDCRICLEEFLEGEELSLMPCGHTFHSACTLRWLTTADSCPTCRFQLY